MNLHRFYAVSQIEYRRNFIFKRHFPIHRIFERSFHCRSTPITWSVSTTRFHSQTPRLCCKNNSVGETEPTANLCGRLFSFQSEDSG